MNDSSNDSSSQLDALFARARAHRPDTSRAEYGFETRLLARLRESRASVTASLWSIMAWRLAPFFAVAVLTLAVWQEKSSSDAADAAAVVGLDNPVAGEIWGN